MRLNFWSSNASKNLIIEDKVGDSALYFNDPASPFMRAIIDLHDYVLIFLAWVLVFVVVILGAILYNNYYTSKAYNFDQTIQKEIIGFKNNSIWYFRHLFEIMIEGSYLSYLWKSSIMLFYYPFVISLFLFSAYLSTRRFFYQIFFGNFINYYMINLEYNKIDFSDVYELEAWEKEWDYATTRVRSWMPKRFFSRYVLTWFKWIWRYRENYFKANVYGGITQRIVDDLETGGQNSNQYFRWLYDYLAFGVIAVLWRWTSAYGSDITTRHWLNINFWYLYTGLILGKPDYSIIKKYQKDDSNWNRVESATFYLILTRMLYAERNQQAIVDGFDFTHNDKIETIWTLFPSFILVLIAIPSLLVLFALDEIGKPIITVKAIGHQWYWSYEITLSSTTTTKTWAFDSYITPVSELPAGYHRNLAVDNALYLPANSHVRVLATSVDVLHSWAVPSLGIKIDVVPGRLNQIGLFMDRPGVFFGQCSEICGPNHGFMPIQIVSTNRSDKWLSLFADNVSWTSDQERDEFIREVSTILPQPILLD